MPHVDWACNVPGLSPDGRNCLSKNTSLVFLHPQNLFLVPFDESLTYRIEDVAEVELSAVDADNAEADEDGRRGDEKFFPAIDTAIALNELNHM